MRWGGQGGGNIEDRRGMGAVGVGGLGAGGVILALIGYFVFGIDPSTTLGVVNGAGAPVQQQEDVRGAPADEAGRFVDVVSGNIDAVWTEVFQKQGRRYQPPAAI